MLRSVISPLLLVAALCGLAGCHRPPAPGRPNILLVSVDTLRADHIGSYGYDRPTSPAIDALAARGVLFERTVANSPWTLPSHGSMLTGLYPRTHGLKSHRTGLREDTPLLAELLRDAGYETIGLVNSRYVSERYGFQRGFDRFRFWSPRVDGEQVRVADQQIDQAMEWLDQAGDGPFFMLWHSYDVHSDYDPTPEYAGMFTRPYDGTFGGTTAELKKVRTGEIPYGEDDLRHTIDLYDAGLREFDAELARLIDFLEARGVLENTVVIVTSDHGEEFMEHGGVLHGQTMYDELLIVPLIVAGPGIPSGVRVDGLSQLTDVFPTVLSLAGVAIPQECEGVDLGPVWEAGRVPDRFAYAEADHKNEENDVKRMVQRGTLKLIYDRLTERHELYDLAADPGEQEDISDRRPEAAQELTDRIRAYMDGERTAEELPPLSREERDNLKALGYLK